MVSTRLGESRRPLLVWDLVSVSFSVSFSFQLVPRGGGRLSPPINRATVQPGLRSLRSRWREGMIGQPKNHNGNVWISVARPICVKLGLRSGTTYAMNVLIDWFCARSGCLGRAFL